MFWYWIWDFFTTGEEEDKNQNISEYCNWLLTVNRQWDMWFKIYIHKNNLILNGFNYSYLNHIRLKKFRGNIVIFISKISFFKHYFIWDRILSANLFSNSFFVYQRKGFINAELDLRNYVTSLNTIRWPK